MIIEEFKYKEELQKYVEDFKTNGAIAPYEVIKNDGRYKVFLESADFIKYIFHHEKHVWFTVVTVMRLDVGEIGISEKDIYESELRYMAEKANLICN